MAVLITCRDCEAQKEASEFYASEIRQGAKPGRCKECVKARVRSYRAANIDRVRAYDRERSKLEHRKEHNRRNSRRYSRDAAPWRSNHPEKYKAHVLVNNALRDGRLIKPLFCEACREEKRLEGHHDDYSKPMEVRWLCRQCHGAHHRALNESRRNAA